MRYDIGTTCRLGNRQSNQDRFGVAESASASFLVLADGMGGHSGGQLAAEVAVDTACQTFEKWPKPIDSVANFLRQVIIDCQISVVEAGLRHDPPMEPKSTLVLCLVQDGEATWAHVGDSRLYVLRQNVIVEHTTDHSHVEELYQQGVISAAQKLVHPERNKITQCMGSRLRPPQPAISDTITLSKGDLLLLCSDGLWGQLKDEDLKQGFKYKDLNRCLNDLAQKAESNVYPRSDNISAVAMRWISNEQSPGDFSDSEASELSDGLDEINRAIDKLQKHG